MGAAECRQLWAVVVDGAVEALTSDRTFEHGKECRQCRFHMSHSHPSATRAQRHGCQCVCSEILMVMWHSSLQHPHHCGVLHLQRDSGPVPGWAVWDLSFSAVFACRSWTPHCRGVLELAEKATEPQPASPFQRLPARESISFYWGTLVSRSCSEK